jgi:hypothetical protein
LFAARAGAGPFNVHDGYVGSHEPNFFVHLMIFCAITSEFSAWYAVDFVLALIICLALVSFGFYTSLAGEPLFRGVKLDE